MRNQRGPGRPGAPSNPPTRSTDPVPIYAPTPGVDSTPSRRRIVRGPGKPGRNFRRTKGSTEIIEPPIVPEGGSYWGDLFPAPADTYWDGLFPEGPVVGIPAPGPTPSGSFALKLESGSSVTWKWETYVHKTKSGLETTRQANLSLPQQAYKGEALLVGDDTRAVRATLARYAALREPFQVGLPWEDMTFSDDAIGNVVFPWTTTFSDWCNPGQRVLLTTDDESYIDAIIQEKTIDSITLDVDPGVYAKKYGRIMPAVLVFLEPQQGFERYPNPEIIELWQINARQVGFGFPMSASPARLSLAPTVTNSGNLDNLTIIAADSGSAGNNIQIRFSNLSLTDGGEYVDVDNLIHVKFMPGFTTVGEVVAMINQPGNRITITGSYVASATMSDGDDEFAPTNLAGGTDAVIAPVGIGASLTTYRTKPVFDRRIVVDETATDSIQAGNEIVDLGATLFNGSDGDKPDWGRQISYRSDDRGEWQWMKKFFHTIKGRQKSFWLPTWRNDITFISKAAGTITVDNAVSDIFAWYPVLRTDLMIQQADNTFTYVRISAFTDNGDGTITLNIVDQSDVAVTLSGVSVTLVSWLELCRLETDEVPVGHSAANNSIATIGRVVTQ